MAPMFQIISGGISLSQSRCRRVSPRLSQVERSPPANGGPDTATVQTTPAISRRSGSTSPTSISFKWRGPTPTARPSDPIVVRGVTYGRGRNGSIVAVDARSGKELWVRENMNGMTNRGMMYWESRDGRDQRLIFAMSDLLQELDAKTGKSIMSFGTNGVVDLRVGIDGRDPATVAGMQSQVPERCSRISSFSARTGEDYMSPPGDIRAYDVLTGKLVWTFHTVPRPGEFGYDTWPKDARKYIGGTNTWGELSVDTRRGIVYVPDRLADVRLLRRRQDRRQPVRHIDRGARCAHGQAPVALPDGAPRSLGFRQQRGAAAHDDSPQRPHAETSSPWRARQAGSTSSIAYRASPSGRLKSGLFLSPICRVKKPGRHSRFRPTRRPSRSRNVTVEDINPYLPPGGVRSV